jgi:hypothetical protein
VTATTVNQQGDADGHKGAIEDETLKDKRERNGDVSALNSDGLPADPTAIAEDRIGANVDDSEVANANETGQTNETPRGELQPLE